MNLTWCSRDTFLEMFLIQAECDKQANQVVDQFIKKRQFKEKVDIDLTQFLGEIKELAI